MHNDSTPSGYWIKDHKVINSSLNSKLGKTYLAVHSHTQRFPSFITFPLFCNFVLAIILFFSEGKNNYKILECHRYPRANTFSQLTGLLFYLIAKDKMLAGKFSMNI